MNESALSATSELATRRRYRLNLGLLFVLQALGSTCTIALVTVNAIVGLRLAPHPSLATLPITFFVVGSALSSFGASLLMARRGRAAGFRAGIASGILGNALCVYAVTTSQFWLLCCGAALYGAYPAAGAFHRFAAVEMAPAARRASALSWVMSAGIVGALLGPTSTLWTKDTISPEFTGTYLSLIGVAMCAGFVTLLLDLPPPQPTIERSDKQSWHSLFRVHSGRTAMLGAIVGYAVMLLLMTATPLAMQHHHHSYGDTALVIQWHVVGMFAPSFLTGLAIKRFGSVQVILMGTLTMAACVALNLAGTSFSHFLFALILLGIGWNMMFVGGSSLLADVFHDERKALAQGVNEFLIFVCNAIASVLAGALLHRLGWRWTNVAALPALLFAAVSCLRALSRNVARPTSTLAE